MPQQLQYKAFRNKDRKLLRQQDMSVRGKDKIFSKYVRLPFSDGCVKLLFVDASPQE